MNDSQLTDIAGLVESLTPYQRLLLESLLADSVSQSATAPSEHPQAQLARLIDSLKPLQILYESLQGATHGAEDDSDIRPFTVGFPEPGHAVVRVSRKILHWPQIWEERAHSWMHEAKLQAMTVDVSRLDELNSSTIAWLVTMAQRIPGGHLTLLGANQAMKRALKVLHLERVLQTSD
jgi:hypothetical protein